MLLLSGMALAVGAVSAFVAYALIWLIAVITNLAFYHRLSAAPAVPAGHHLGYAVVLVPVVGGAGHWFHGALWVGKDPWTRHSGSVGGDPAGPFPDFTRRWPSSSRSRRPSRSAPAGRFGAEGPIIMTGGAFGSI